ncbi:MAG: ribosomal-processing cysteine protease Prp [Firmicutes bacterium]|nr:ribosomal-processing cysteine protease Prp [Bacillota bacterium]
MIQVRLWRTAAGEPARLTVTGHADRGAYGQDIVCAAASALVETLIIGLNTVLHESPMGSVDPGDADLAFRQPLSSEARAVVETIAAGLKDLAETEPNAVRFDERVR